MTRLAWRLKSRAQITVGGSFLPDLQFSKALEENQTLSSFKYTHDRFVIQSTNFYFD